MWSVVQYMRRIIHKAIYMLIADWIFLLIPFIFFSCYSEGQKKMKSPAGYNLNKPVIINLSKKIDEISGIAYSSSDSSLFAIDDNTGFLYKIRLTKGPDIQKWEFGKKADYEDLVLVDSAFYILESSGKIIHFPLKFPITEAKLISWN